MSSVASFWMGDRLGFLARLCIASAFDVGHEYVVYSYEPDKILDAPDGLDLRDASEIMPREDFLLYQGDGSPALGSDLFRYRMLEQGKGPWLDLDMLMLKPIPDEDYVFGAEHQGSTNTAIIKAPADSAIVEQLVEMSNSTDRPPWYGPRRSLLYYWLRLTKGRKFTLEWLPWGAIGPELLTYCVEKQGLSDKVAPPEVWYPIPWRQIDMLYGPAEAVDALLTDQTRGIHLYASQLRGLAEEVPPKGSYIEREARRLGVWLN